MAGRDRGDAVTPTEHDERLLVLERELRSADKLLLASERAVRIAQGQRRRGDAWVAPDGSQGTLLEILEVLPDSHPLWIRKRLRQDCWRDIEKHETGYTGWARYRLVISSDGHVHGDPKCRSFRPTTQTVVIPDLSDKPPSAVIEMLGNACCTVCVPGAKKGAEKISSSLVNILVKRGSAEFAAALARRKRRVTDVTLTQRR